MTSHSPPCHDGSATPVLDLRSISTGTPPGCGYNPSACDLVGEVFCTLGERCVVSCLTEGTMTGRGILYGELGLNGTSLRTFNGLKVIRKLAEIDQQKSYPCVSALAYPALAAPWSDAFEGLVNPRDGCARSDAHTAAYRPVHHWDLGNSTRGAVGCVKGDCPCAEVYKMCWSYDPQVNETESPASLENMEMYRGEAGYLMMLGPLAMDFECFSQEMMRSSESDDCRCGDGNVSALDDRWNSASVPATVAVDAMGNYNLRHGSRWYSFGANVGKSGVALRICWAHDPSAEAAARSVGIEDSSLYRVEIDPDFFWFRLTAIVDCVTGSACTVKVLGSGILPSSQVLLIANAGRCGHSNATVLSLPGFTNPAPLTGVTGTGPSSLARVSGVTWELGIGWFNDGICWGSDPGNGTAVHYPFEVEPLGPGWYPNYYDPSSFFPQRVGSVGLVQLDSENQGSTHRVLAIYSDPSETWLWTSNTLTGSVAEWPDYDCCRMAGHASGSVLRLDATNAAKPSEGYVFHQRPSVAQQGRGGGGWWLMILMVNNG
eukprot:Skav211608  [mRNA]  locus=scaffold3083:21391:39875:- [translate_table: standard]